MWAARTVAFLLLLAAGLVGAETRATARSTTEFLQLLRDLTAGCRGQATLLVASPVALGQRTADSTRITLPLSLPANCTLQLLGEGDGLQELELGAFSDGGIPQRLLFLESGSMLVLRNLNLTGVASPAVGKVGLPTGIDSIPGFLAIGGEPGSSMQLLNSSVVFFPGEWCSPGLAAAAAQGLQQTALSGTTAADSSTVQMFNLTLAVQIRSSLPEAPGTEGVMNIFVDQSNFTCRQQPEVVGGAGAAANMSYAAIQPVYSPAEFMAALAAQAGNREPGAGCIVLERSIALRPEDATSYRLPMNISANRTLAIEGAGNVTHGLDFGGIPLLLYLEPASGLVLRNVNVSSTAHIGMFGVFANDQSEEQYDPAVQALLTHVDSSPLFPTINNGLNTQVEMTNVSILLRPSRLCTPELVQQQVQGFAQLLGASGRLRTSGTTATIEKLSLPVPITQTSTGTPIGMGEVEMNNVSITCTGRGSAGDNWRAVPRQRVADASQLLAALAAEAAADGPGIGAIEISSGIVLDDASIQRAALPFTISRGRTLVLVGGGDSGGTIHLAAVERLLLLEPGAALVLANLSVTGFGPLYGDAPSGRQWANGTQTHMDPFPLYPTVNASPTSTLELYNSSVSLHHSEACTRDVLTDQIQLFRLLTGNPASVELLDQTVVIHNFSASSVPVFNATTNQTIGRMTVRATNLNVTCPLPPGSAAASGSSGGDGGGGAPAYVWALVGLAATAVVTGAASAALLIRRQRRRQGAASSSQLDKDPESTSEPPAGLPTDTETEEGDQPGVSPASPAFKRSTSLAHAPSGELQDGLWRNRVGFVEGLVLGGVLGSGGYGRVYRGTWRGAKVAVKVVATHVSVGDTYDLTREPLLSMSLSHPNLLPTFKTCVVRLLPEPASSMPSSELTLTSSGSAAVSMPSGSLISRASSPTQVVRSILDRNALVEVMPMTAVLQPGEYETWLVSEYADRGSLADAIKRQQFKSVADAPGCDMATVLLCLLDVARGLEYLHSCSIVHGDLKKENVLLKSERRDRRGYVCKLGDFGLSRLLAEHQSHVKTGSYGTASIAAPELLSHGRLAKSSDIYAFGILLWELLSCQAAFSDTPALQILWMVAHQKWRPPVPEGCPPALADLMQQCWHDDQKSRPSAQQVVADLTSFADSYMQQQPRPDAGMRSRPPSGALPAARSGGVAQRTAGALQPPASAAGVAQEPDGVPGSSQPAASAEGSTQPAVGHAGGPMSAVNPAGSTLPSPFS